jgi:hypothetical protein
LVKAFSLGYTISLSRVSKKFMLFLYPVFEWVIYPIHPLSRPLIQRSFYEARNQNFSYPYIDQAKRYFALG